MSTTSPSIFTKILHNEIPGFVAFEDEIVFVLISLEGHPLIIPKVEYCDIYDIPEEVAAHIMKIAVRMSKVITEVTNCDGVNLIQSNGAAAGQEVFHFHLHIKPRFKNDEVKISWNTTTKPEDFRSELMVKIKSKFSSST